MPFFGRFKANFQLLNKKKRFDENIGSPICGAYRINREEFLNNNVDSVKKNPSPVLNREHKEKTLNTSQSTEDIINDPNQTLNARRSMPDIAQPKPAPRVNKGERETKRFEKQQLEQEKLEQKKREKLALHEQQRQEKIKKDREKMDKTVKEKSDNKSKKRAAPQHKIVELNSNIPTPPALPPANYFTNSRHSTISRSSGPPPYSKEPVTNQWGNNGNTSFSQSEEQDSWDIILKHREQLNRPKTNTGYSKKTHMDLNYNNIQLRSKNQQ